MDIDLSNETGQAENGLALTAGIRAAQNRGDIPPFPIVRFSYRARVAENIGHDPSSDDFFDLAIDKDGFLATGAVTGARNKLKGTAEVYSATAKKADATALMNVDVDRWRELGHPTFDEDLLYANRPHLKAGVVVKALENPGLLIDEPLLAARLGVDAPNSAGWPALRLEIESIAYSGVGAQFYPRWWSRGLELWWSEKLNVEDPLVAYTVTERVAILGLAFADLSPLTMPLGSPGQRPWRLCTLTMEKTGEFLPVDADYAVPYRPRSPLPDWLDPTYAALGPAIKNSGDLRLDRDELSLQKRRIQQG